MMPSGPGKGEVDAGLKWGGVKKVEKPPGLGCSF